MQNLNPYEKDSFGVRYRPLCSGWKIFPDGKKCKGCKDCSNSEIMATKAKTPAKKKAPAKKKTPAKKKAPVSKTRLLTLSERKGLSNKFYAQINGIDNLIDKNISPQTKADLRMFRSQLKKASPILTRF